MKQLLSREILALLVGATLALVGAVIENDVLLGAGLGLATGIVPTPASKKP
jgi:hypothetical protein